MSLSKPPVSCEGLPSRAVPWSVRKVAASLLLVDPSLGAAPCLVAYAQRRVKVEVSEKEAKRDQNQVEPIKT